MTQAITRKSLYETDFLLWTEETIAKLKARDFDHVDLENLIEEIESLGKSDKKEIKSRLTTLLAHLLKRIYVNMPQEFNGWERTIRNQRTDLELALMDSPSLKAIWNEAFDIAFRLALRNVRDEYEKKGYHIPEQWQFSREIDAMLSVKFWDE
ncbi:MAG: DUF29 domain-containing protein [Pseudanabaena sp.]|jgi:hypothetical protein|nr:DUF29 domain-containing protein [Pseudanabaena sp. M090S1SP2A07QC]MCA6505235.1 DUF29 domain-containing protein [Pseudanabaena sp. M172S2SP2A07QC]MCA6511043.1 DUF29 domain-containing protein [Pseudanabaena sp. M109S1SP2A07QC]MCA6520205.1 DUF29 domain-containing protein [Pseudanabaena sp. M110S1SP2A07QC]MCA6520923.1 DUF29 domain-containing protein [Pseudanabaena sp. M051S1SP2A07QC]MCA6525699.1 DUF29 domain-containing protein [Pseudanabaena sp. M179S2SP2A07QC]MCA6529260.1 DUF29 domain-contain